MAKSGLMTPPEVAEYLHVAEGTLTQWRYRGVGPKYLSISNAVVRYRETDLESWLAEKEQAPNGG